MTNHPTPTIPQDRRSPMEHDRDAPSTTPATPAQPVGQEPVAWEPTEAMLIAARDWSDKKYGKPIGNDAAIGCWQAMIAASALAVGDRPQANADRLACKIEDLIAEFGSDPTTALTCISEWLQERRHEKAHPATPAPVEAGLATMNDWFLALPEGRQKVLREDKWMLANAAFEAGRAQSAPVGGEGGGE